MNILKRKLANLAEYLHPEHVKGVARGESREKLKSIRQGLRPKPAEHLVKQATVRGYAKQFDCPVLVETGTFRGHMIAAMLESFDEIHSIELSEELFGKAKQRFADHRHVHLHRGDSGEVLPKLLTKINRPVLFWLDAHASGGETATGTIDTPIVAELEEILRHPVKSHVILIDDAREFGVGKHYPAINRLKKMMAGTYPVFEVKDDIVRITTGPYRG